MGEPAIAMGCSIRRKPSRQRTILGLAMLFALLSSGAEAADPIRVAFAGPTTGPSARDGLSAAHAIELAFERVNDAGGIAGRPLVLDLYDDRNDRALALELAPQIVAQRETVAVIGHNFSTCSIAAGRVYAEGGLPAIATAATSVAVTRDNPWYFRVIFNDRLQGRFIVLYAREVLGVERLAIVHETDAYGAYLSDVMRAAAPEVGLPIDQVWPFDPDDDAAQGERLDRIAREASAPGGPPALVLAMQPSAGVALVERLRALDYPGLLIVTDALASQAFSAGFDHLPAERRRPGFYTNGIYASTPYLFDTGGKLADAFAQAYVERHDALPDWYAAFAYDAAMVLVDAIRRSGVAPSSETIEADRSAIRVALAALGPDNAVEGITGATYFDEVGDALKPIPMGRFMSGEISSAFGQLQLLPGIHRIEDLPPDLDPARVVPWGRELLYRTSIARVGVRARHFGEIDFNLGEFELDFDIWFRHMGSRDVEDIVFTNAIEPVDLGAPIDEWQDGEQSYRLYRARAKLRADDLPSSYAEHVLSLSFHHRTRTRDDLILAVDSLGMNRGRRQSSRERLAHARKLLAPASLWRPTKQIVFESETDAHALGHPNFMGSPGASRRFSELTMGLIVQRDSLASAFAIPKPFRTVALIVALLASIALMAWQRFPYPKLRWLLQALFAALLLVAAEPTIGAFLRDRAGSHQIQQFNRSFDVVWWVLAAVLINIAIRRFIWTPTERHTGHSVPSILRYFVATTIYLLTFFGIMAFVFDYTLTGLLATSGVLAMIIGLAVQLNITNIFAGVAINLERPFRVGDWIMIHGRTHTPDTSVIGQVTDINWRTTRLKTAMDTEVIIPNGVISEKTITNFMTPGEMSRFEVYFTIDQSEPPERVIAIMKRAIDEITGSENQGPIRDPAPSVRVRRVTEQGIEYVVRYRLIPREVSIAKARHTVIQNILKHLRAEGISLAYPKRQYLPAQASASTGDAPASAGTEAS